MIAGSDLGRRANEIGEALRRGDKKALSSCSPAERKELVAEMLRNGLFVNPPFPAVSNQSRWEAPLPEDMTPSQDMAMRGALQGLTPRSPREKARVYSPTQSASLSPPSKKAASEEVEDVPFERESALRGLLMGIARKGE